MQPRTLFANNGGMLSHVVTRGWPGKSSAQDETTLAKRVPRLTVQQVGNGVVGHVDGTVRPDRRSPKRKDTRFLELCCRCFRLLPCRQNAETCNMRRSAASCHGPKPTCSGDPPVAQPSIRNFQGPCSKNARTCQLRKCPFLGE